MAEHTRPETAAPHRADAIANRKRLIEAAREAFAELGAAAEVKDIAERAGVGVGTIYRHFDNKEDLLREVILEATSDFDRDIAEWEQLGDPVESLRRHLTALLTATENYGWLFDAALGGQLPERVTQGLDDRPADARLMAVLGRGVDEGAFAPDLDVIVAANILLGLTMTWKYGTLRESMTVEEAVERTMRLFLGGAERR